MTRQLMTLLSLLALSAFIAACGGDTTDEAAADLSSATTQGDMGEQDPSCTQTSECTGDFAGFECVAGVCTDCGSGADACTCRANGTCDSGLKCEDGLCTQCEGGEEGCPCAAGMCDEGLACSGDDVCVVDDCVEGEDGCPCSNGACDGAPDSYCDVSNVCQECSTDVAGCPCDDEQACSGDNYCDTDNGDVCTVCPELDRKVGCGCAANSDCEVGLVCDAEDSVCRDKLPCSEVCVAFQECDQSGAGDPVCIAETCQSGYMWMSGACVQQMDATCDGRNNSTDLSATCAANNKECVEDALGRASCVDTCEILSDTCEAAERDCDPGANLTDDAVCGACRPGYLDDGAGTCVLDSDSNCSTFGDPDSIAGSCADRNRACVELETGGATCGECLMGFEEQRGSNACVESLTCGGVVCAETEYCQFSDAGGPPSCQPLRCADGEAEDTSTGLCTTCNISCDDEGLYPTIVDGACACASEVSCKYQTDGTGGRCFVSACPEGEAATPGGQCVTCNNTCGDNEGERARLWPETTLDGTCFCEVLEGYAIPFGGSGSPIACDEDEDGWINSTSFETFNTATTRGDEAVLANFRCERRQIDRFTLQNEWGQRRNVSLCGDDLVDYAPGEVESTVCAEVDGYTHLNLVEPDKLDNNDDITLDDTLFPRHGTRKMTAGELNGLTKGCVSQNADFNLNNVEDLGEEHAITKTRVSGLTFAGSTANEDFAFHSMSYFMELHQGFYEPAAISSDPGSYVIAERSRCDAGFTLGFGASSGYSQQCTRLRRRDYDYASSHVGFDFAHWGCDDSTGSCAVPLPPVDASRDDTDFDNIPDHGLCERSDPVPNEPWWGMNHHSQFQCVVLKNTVNAASNEELAVGSVFRSAEATPQPYEFNRCDAVDCSAGGMNCAEVTDQGVNQPKVTEIECTQVERDAVSQDEIGWAAIRYIPEGVSSSFARPYIRGCIDESYGLDGTDGYSELCPGYVDNPMAVFTAGNPGDSGKLICSCNRFFGGSNCEVSCLERTYANPAASGALATSYVHVGDRDRGYDSEQVADYACGLDDNYCSLHPPIPAENFPGGRRGYWMCGDTSLTRTIDDQGASVPYLEKDATIDGQTKTYQVQGTIKLMPVKRELVVQDNCTSNCYSAF